VHDNVFRTNHWHFRGDWGGMQGMLFADNRFEVIGEPKQYEFFALKQSTAATTRDMVFRDNMLVPPADYERAHLLYAKLKGTVAVVGDDKAKPEITWRVVEGIGGPKVATPGAVESELSFENPKESWLQQAELELMAKLGDRTVSDRVTIRQDADITPKAVITAPKEAKLGTIVQLDASRSKEPRAFPPDRVRYQWKQSGGPRVDLSSTEWIDPIFFPGQPGTYTFELTVSSPIATSRPASVAVEVSRCITGHADQAAPRGARAGLRASRKSRKRICSRRIGLTPRRSPEFGRQPP